MKRPQGVQRLHVDGGSDWCGAPNSKLVDRPVLQLRFPRCDLVGVNVKLLRQLSQRAIALDGGKRHLRP